MASIEFTAYPRQGGDGRGASRRLRASGKAPGIVYGGSAEPTQIELDHNALIHALRNEAFHASILTMKLGSAAQKVLLRDVQMHPYRPQVLHVDFQRIDENKKIHMKVPLHFANAESSPAVKLGGAVVIVTDSNRDRAHHWRSSQDVSGFTETGGVTRRPWRATKMFSPVHSEISPDGFNMIASS